MFNYRLKGGKWGIMLQQTSAFSSVCRRGIPTGVKYILSLHENEKGKLALELFSGSLRGLDKY